MSKVLAVITLLFAKSAFAESLPACPDSGADPTKFCPVGMIWSDASQSCVAMV
jgi:hypothetical protein